ncbi:MAG: hypothetical protein AAGF13_07310 [Pseudomonadota bacterium]
MGVFKSLARAPWWLLAAIAVAFTYFGNVFPAFSYGTMPDLLGMLEMAAPEIGPAIAWLESMGFNQNASFGIQQETWFESRAPIFAVGFAGAAVLRLFLGGRKEWTEAQSDSFLNDPKTLNAILKDAPGAISEEAWNDPLSAHGSKDVAASATVRPQPVGPTPRRVKGAGGRKALPKQRGSGFMSGARRAKKSPERQAMEATIRAKLEEDPFDRLARGV